MDACLWLVDRDERARHLAEGSWTPNSKGKLEREVTVIDDVLAGSLPLPGGLRTPLFFKAVFECDQAGGVKINSFFQQTEQNWR